MPCWTVTSTEVNLDKADRGVLESVLQELGFYINTPEYSRRFDAEFTADHLTNRTSLMIKNGQVFVTAASRSKLTAQQQSLEIMRRYTHTVVTAGLKRFGWTVAKQKDENRMVIRRRS